MFCCVVFWFVLVWFIPRLWVAADGSCSQLSRKQHSERSIWRIKGGGQINSSPRHPLHIPVMNGNASEHELSPDRSQGAWSQRLREYKSKEGNHLFSHQRMPWLEGTQVNILRNVLIGKMEKLGPTKRKKRQRSPTKLAAELRCKYKLSIHYIF